MRDVPVRPALLCGALLIAVVFATSYHSPSLTTARTSLDASELPESMVSGPNGELVVVRQGDTFADVVVYDRALAQRSHVMLGFFSPGLAIDTTGRLYFAGDVGIWTVRHLVEVYTTDFVHLSTWSWQPDQTIDLDGSPDGTVVMMRGATKWDRTHLRDGTVHRITRQSVEGRVLDAWRGPSSAYALAVAPTGAVYVVRNDGDGGPVVERFDADGSPLGSFPIDGKLAGWDFAADGTLFAVLPSEAKGSQVIRYRIDGADVDVIDRWQTCDWARDLAVTTDGRVHVAAIGDAPFTGMICTYEPDGRLRGQTLLPDHTGIITQRPTEPGTRSWLPTVFKRR